MIDITARNATSAGRLVAPNIPAEPDIMKPFAFSYLSARYEVVPIVVPAGEASKTRKSWSNRLEPFGWLPGSSLCGPGRPVAGLFPNGRGDPPATIERSCWLCQ